MVWRKVEQIHFPFKQGTEYRIRRTNNDIVIEADLKPVKAWIDVTDQCEIEVHQSKACKGVYIEVTHGDKSFPIGIDGRSKFMSDEYRIISSPRSTVSCIIEHYEEVED